VSELTYHDFLAKFGIGGAHPGGLALTRDILSKQSLKGKKVLEIGCGTGQTTALLVKEIGCKVTALDQHPLMIEKAKRRFLREKVNVDLRQADAHKLPFAGNSYEVILSESVTIFTDLSKSLSEYARVLRRGGVLLLLEMTAERPLSANELHEVRSVYGTKQVPTEAEWVGRLQRAGFGQVQVLAGGSVASAMQEANQEGAVPEFDPSPTIDPNLYAIGARHHELVEKYARRLGYRFYRAVLT